MSHDRLAAHLKVDRYGDFLLTEAVRPSLDRQVIPRQGYRVATYRDNRSRLTVPVLAASISRDMLFDVFMEMMEPLGEVVDVVLETSHETEGSQHQDLFREHIDLPVLKSSLCDFEDVLLNDGCTGIAVIAHEKPMELQFDEHKLLVVYARNLKPFEKVLRAAKIPLDPDMKLITEGEHLHSTDRRFLEPFQQLCYRLGVAEPAEHVNW